MVSGRPNGAPARWHHELEILPDADAVARRGATLLTEVARGAVAAEGRFTLAVSGGRTPWAMFGHLDGQDLPWHRVGLWQVDERVAPDGDPDRNLTHLLTSLPPGADPSVHPMPVTEQDLESAATGYSASLPRVFDLVHLGLGDDGHTASLVPGDPVLEITEQDVALTREFRGRPRMTLTYPAIGRARRLLWLVTGQDKAPMLPRLLAGDPSIPAGRVRAVSSIVVADAAAATRLGPGG